MRVAVIIHTSGGMSGGLRAYLVNVIPRLASNDSVSRILVMAPEILKLESVIGAHHKIDFSFCAPHSITTRNLDFRALLSHSQFHPDIIFSPIERGSFYRQAQAPFVRMVLNMSPWYSHAMTCVPMLEKMRLFHHRVESRRNLNSATHVIAPTKFVENFLTNDLHVPASRVTTIPFGFKQLVAQTKKPPSLPADLNGSFIFTAGSIDPYRGLEDLFLACKTLGQARLRISAIVIAGTPASHMRGLHNRLITMAKSHVPIPVYWTGMLTSSEMSWCYTHCTHFVLTSRVEAFGMIGLEALGHGCLCVVANTPPFQELFCHSALYYRSRDPNSLAQAITTCGDLSESDRSELVRSGQSRADQFSWDQTALQTVDVFRLYVDRVRL